MDLIVTHRPGDRRFVAVDGDRQVGQVDYRPVGDVLEVFHTETAVSHRGRGVAADLTVALLDFAEGSGLRVRPICPYTVSYLRSHPEWAHLTI